MEHLNENICLLQNAKLGFNFMNLTTKRIISSEWYDNVGKFSNCATWVSKNYFYSLINTNGERITNEWYDYVYDFQEGFAMVYKENLGWNLIDIEGKYITDEWYDNVGYFNNGFARVKKDGLGYTFINTEGKRINNEWYDYATSFDEGFAQIWKSKWYIKNNLYNFLGTDGKLYDCNKQLV